MRYYDKITPDGTKDLLFGECDQRSQVTKTLKDLFTAQGYRRVMTPALEFYDVFGRAAKYLPKETMYKLTDHKGRLMVLCPDCTVPVARLTATRLKGMPMPLRLFYNHNIYRMFPELKGKSAEINQVGIELIGGERLRSDLEVVELAARSLDLIGGGKYRLELCHIGYFKAIMNSLDVDEELKEEIRYQIEQKNYASLTDILGEYKDSKAARALLKLPRLFGGAEVFEKAYELFDENGAKESLDYLKGVYEYLQELGLGNKVIIDLGLVNLAEYYTGIIFRGYFQGIGEQVLSGGRYDMLLKEFGEDQCSIGFGINVDMASQKVKPMPESIPEVLVFAPDMQYMAKAVCHRRELESQGILTENCVFDTMEEAFDYAKMRGIPKVHLVGEDITICLTKKN
ncbi:MAG: ATP phosphoribosyltransferase regulatory subunit [Blautia sp.]|nr:ATP phosphoribosyltransferase regulatory subunit [Blautia sp.]MDD7370291.1 ATP phosphoribosyltransferase regulatory subunit [Bacillota bacterium]MDY3715100.1 ATP phosphoribosyltransferase regulatory subunit [Blautia sp.]